MRVFSSYDSLGLKCLTIFFLLSFESSLFAQLDSSDQKSKVQLSGFLDIYYCYDFNKPQTNYRQLFLYNHNRHNEFNLNLGLVKLSLEQKKYRANFALQAGTYVQDNYSSEQVLLRHVNEANIGVRLDKKNKWWLDAGIMPSHIGFESAISADCWTITRSLLAENTPYFMAGAKVSYAISDSLKVSALVCNGWQRIQRVLGNSMPSFGTQLTWTANKYISFNWSTFIGTDDPDSTRRMRYFNNFYSQINATARLGFILGFDIGTQQDHKESMNYRVWHSAALIAKYELNDKWTMALRGEYYKDLYGVIIPTGTIYGFNTSSASMNFDYHLNDSLVFRIEGRYLHTGFNLFRKGDDWVDHNMILIGSLVLKL